jgi:hypothetical protein
MAPVTWLLGLAARLWPYALAAALVLGAWLYVDGLRESLAETRSKLAATESQLEAETIRREAEKRNHESIIAALAAERAAADQRAANLAQARDVVSRTPDADDGPVAPVLRNALDALRRRLQCSNC